MRHWETETKPEGKGPYLVTVKTSRGLKVEKSNYPWTKEVIAWAEYPQPYDESDIECVVENDLYKRFNEMIHKPAD